MPLSEAPRATVWPSPERAIPANTGWIVLAFNVPVAAADVAKLVLNDGAVRVEARWAMLADDPYVRGAILWGPFADARCPDAGEPRLCAGHDYVIDSVEGVHSVDGVVGHALATLHVGDASLTGPEWTTLGSVRASDVAVRLTRGVDGPCVLRAPEVPLAGSDPATIFDMEDGEVTIEGLAPATTYDWRLECVDAVGRSTPPWRVQFVTEAARRVVISEVVVDPQHDWNDSSGARGLPFDADAAFTDRASSTDEWVELYNRGDVPVDLSAYVVQTLDTSPAEQRVGDVFAAKVAQGFSVSGSAILGPSERLVLRLSPSGENAANDARLRLMDELGLVRDEVTLGKDGVPSGDAHGPADEAVSACVSGDVRVWKKTSATPAAPNPCEGR